MELWYAIQVQSCREKFISEMLRSKNFDVCLLLHRLERQWSDRKKQLELAVFPGYVFCRFDLQRRVPVLATPGVIGIVGHGRVPEPISEEEIRSLRLIESSQRKVSPWPYIVPSEQVEIQGGSLDGLRGILLEHKSEHRLVVSISLLQRAVAVELDSYRVRRLPLHVRETTSPETPSNARSWNPVQAPPKIVAK